MTESNAITRANSEPAAGSLAYLTDAACFEHIWRVGKAFAASRMVPTHFQGKPEDCFVALQMAMQLGVNPLLALQNITVISGRPGFNAQFAISLANQRGPFTGPITWSSKGKGNDLAVTAKAVIAATGEQVEVTVDMGMAVAEGWTRNPKYKSIPEQMLRYRSATWLIRLYCPEVLMGFSSTEELQDMNTVQRTEVKDVTPVKASTLDDLNQQIAKAEPPAATEVVITQDEPDATDADDIF